MTPSTPPGVPSADAGRFSLVLGGPLFQLLRRGRLTDDALGLVHRRIILAVAVTWPPLLVLSALRGAAFGGGVTLPFLNDIECHVRFLLAVPLLIGAERIVHQRMQPMVRQFEARGLVPPGEKARFADAVARASRLRNSVLAEVVLLALVYVVGIEVVWARYAAMHTGGWYLAPGGGRLSVAGLWFVLVSLPIFQFLLYRWYFRLFIWVQFLWRVSRLDLDLQAAHPDKAGGLGFLGGSLAAFVPIAAAHGVLLSGMMANKILYAGAKLPDFELEMAGAVAVLLTVFAGPLLVFTLMLSRVKRAGLGEYGSLAQTYVREFRTKWIRGGAPADEPLIGSADIQSLADLNNSYGAVAQMRFVPLSATGVIQFVAAILLPILPLALTIMPAEEVIQKLIGIVV